MARPTMQQLHKALRDQAAAEERSRKEHDGLVFKAGRAYEAAGLLDMDEVTRGGMLDACAEQRADMSAKWRARGIKLLKEKDGPPKVTARATFAAEVSLPKSARTALAEAGLKEIRKPAIKLGFGLPETVQLWTGELADYARSESIVSELGGTLSRLGVPAAAE